jgi:structural maintenance of chromosome 3 (chondroitin sulfate proteoglycan 6)
MKDRERLDLLKEVAGTRVYETRRAESLKIMDETGECRRCSQSAAGCSQARADSKRTKINELLEYIEARLSELDEEKEELKQYYEKDKERRCLEYALYYRSLQDHIAKLEEVSVLRRRTECNTEHLAQLEDKRRGEADASNAKQRTFNDREKTLSDLKNELQTLQQEAEQVKLEKESLRNERRELVRQRALLEARVGDDEEGADSAAKDEMEAQLERVDGRISELEGELMGLLPTYEDQRQALDEARGT